MCDAWQQEVIHTDVSGDLPGEHEQYSKSGEHTVDTGGTSHDEVPIGDYPFRKPWAEDTQEIASNQTRCFASI